MRSNLIVANESMLDARRVNARSKFQFLATLVKWLDAVGSVIQAAIASVEASFLVCDSTFLSVFPGYPLNRCSSAELFSVSPDISNVSNRTFMP
jgi:hypothetical protein